MILGLLVAQARAHIGGLEYPVYEIPAGQEPDLGDGSLQDWTSFAPAPSLTINDFASPIWGRIGDRPANVSDFNIQIYLGWSLAMQRIFVGIQRLDDHYLSTCPEDEGGQDIWGFEGIEITMDGDHSGGYYALAREQTVTTVSGMSRSTSPLFSLRDTSDTFNPSLFNHQQAQHFYISTEGAGYTRVRLGGPPQPTWLGEFPYGEIGGLLRQGSIQDTSIVELMLAPFDHFDTHNKDLSQPSQLRRNGVIGLQVGLADHDRCGFMDDFLSLSGLAQFREQADVFMDFLLLPCQACESTHVERTPWRRVKTRFQSAP